MKKIMITAAALVMLAACGGHSHNHGTHVHEDGTVHQDHSAETAKPAAQESFKAEADTTDTEDHHDHGHSHDHGHGHSHQH